MPTKKNTTATTEAVKPAAKAAPVKKTTAAPEVKAKTTPAAAATHKAPARKSAAPTQPAKAAAAMVPAFDENAYRAEIEREAYLFWESRGCAHGQAHEDWQRAVELVRTRLAK